MKNSFKSKGYTTSEIYHKDNYLRFDFFQGLFSRITFALPVVLGSPEGHFSNTGHFLESSGAFQGCIRNLEINNKLYSFALQNNGGDAIEGVDIGSRIN